jgi:quercetin dioxygenase-like cupin family protein
MGFPHPGGGRDPGLDPAELAQLTAWTNEDPNMKAKFFVASIVTVLVASASIGADSPPQSQAAKRTVLSRTDVPNSNYEVLMVLVEVPANTRVGRHTHPGKVVGYVVAGDYTISIDGERPRSLQPQDTLEVPSGAVHDEYTAGKPAKLIAVFTVEKGKPLTIPAAP